MLTMRTTSERHTKKRLTWEYMESMIALALACLLRCETKHTQVTPSCKMPAHSLTHAACAQERCREVALMCPVPSSAQASSPLGPGDDTRSLAETVSSVRTFCVGQVFCCTYNGSPTLGASDMVWAPARQGGRQGPRCGFVQQHANRIPRVAARMRCASASGGLPTSRFHSVCGLSCTLCVRASCRIGADRCEKCAPTPAKRISGCASSPSPQRRARGV